MWGVAGVVGGVGCVGCGVVCDVWYGVWGVGVDERRFAIFVVVAAFRSGEL